MARSIQYSIYISVILSYVIGCFVGYCWHDSVDKRVFTGTAKVAKIVGKEEYVAWYRGRPWKMCEAREVESDRR